MTTNALLLHLHDFGRHAPRDRCEETVTDSGPAGVEACMETAVAAAVAEERRRSDEDMRMRLAEADEGAQARLRELRAEWAREIGDALADQLRVGLSDIEDGISNALASLVQPMTTETRRNRIVEAFVATCRKMMRENDAVRLSLAGPGDVVDAIASRFREDGVRVDLAADEAPALVAQIDEAVVKARLDGTVAEAFADAG
jgi:hypothetical protein